MIIAPRAREATPDHYLGVPVHRRGLERVLGLAWGSVVDRLVGHYTSVAGPHRSVAA